jgi:hypothetical protein
MGERLDGYNTLILSNLACSKAGHESTDSMVCTLKCTFCTIAFETPMVSNGSGKRGWTERQGPRI